MTSPHVPGTHPWVAEGQKKLRFGIAQPGGSDWNERRDFAQAADELGFDTLWYGDHPALSSDCWATLAALAATTRRIRLVSITCAPIRGPHWLARLAADVDHISAGRLILGLGAGWAEGEFAFFGHPFLPIGERLRFVEETVQEIRSVWADPPLVKSFLDDVMIERKFAVGAIQQPYIPLLIAGAGEKVILRQVADYADMCDIEIWKARTPADVQRKFAVLRRFCEERGRPYDTVIRGFHDNLFTVADNASGVSEKLDRLAFLQSVPGFRGCTPRELIERHRSIVDVGANHLTFAPWLADVSTLRLLAEQVMPELREHYEATTRQLAALGGSG